jgi:hypothetical protein
MNSQAFSLRASALAASALFLTTVSFANERQQEQKIPTPPAPAEADVKSVPVIPPKPAEPEVVGTATPMRLQTPPSQLPVKGVDVGTDQPVLPRIPADVVIHDVDESGELLSGAAEYKARFTTSAVTYYPRFPSAPGHTPLEFRLSDVTVGGQALGFLAGVSPVRTADRIEYLRGTLVEVYEIRPDGMEQKFVFPSLPRSGEIVLRVGLETGLLGEPAEGGGLTFSNEYGRVGYTQAVAVDAAGQRLALATELAGDAIEIRVPAGFADQAVMPLTIDPLVGVVFTVDAPPVAMPDSNADVAHEAGSGNFNIVWERAFNAGDHDVWSQLHTAAGTLVAGSTTTIDFTTTTWINPKVASNNLDNIFFTVAQRGVAPTRQIWGRSRSATTTTVGTQFMVSPTDQSGDKLNPDIGGDPVLVGPTYFFVVWQRIFTAADHDVHGIRVNSVGSATIGTTTVLIENATTNETNPSVSKSDGNAPFATQRWTVVFQRTFNATDEDIYGRQYTWDGVATGATFLIDFSGLNDRFPVASSPLDAASGERDYLVTYQRGSGTANDVQVHLRNAAASLSNVELYSLLSSTPFGGDQIRPECDSDGSQFAVAWCEQFSTSTTDYDTHICQLNGSANALGESEGRVIMGFSTTTETLPRLTSDLSGGAGGNDACFMAAWQDNTGEDIIEGARYCGLDGGPIAGFCFGTAAACPCGNAGGAGRGCANSIFATGALLSATGAADMSNDTLSLNGSGLSGNNALFFQGTAQSGGGAGTIFGDGLRCAAGTVIRLGTEPVTAAGNSTHPGAGDPDISVSGAIPAGGATRYYQIWYRNVAAFCTPNGWNLSNGLTVEWVQ